MEPIIEQIYTDVINGRHKTIPNDVQTAISAGLSAVTILQEGMIAAMQEVGRLFEQCEYYVPEMLVAARAMQAGLAVLKPHLVIAEFSPAGKVAIGTVSGDYHDIGKNLVKMMLEGAGFYVIDLGVDVPKEIFVAAVSQDKVDIIAMSALITTTMQNMRPVIESLEKAGIRNQVKILVGGAPLTEKFADIIGADGYAPDASRAVSVAKNLVAK